MTKFSTSDNFTLLVKEKNKRKKTSLRFIQISLFVKSSGTHIINKN